MTDAPRRVLLVDDDGTVLRALRRFMVGEGFEVETASNADEALQRLRGGFEAQIVISDFKMPGEDGVSFLGRVHREWPLMQRVLMTGHRDVQALENAINVSHIYWYIPKPWDEPGLLATLRSALVQYELESENARLQSLFQAQNRKLTDANRELEAKVDERTALLSRAKREWEVAFDTLVEPLMLIDEEYRIVRANLAMATHLGRGIKELPGAVCHELRATSPNAFPRGDDGICRGCPVARTRAGGTVEQAELDAPDDRLFQIGVFPIVEDVRGEVVCRYRDLTGERSLARKMAQADKLAAMGLLAGGVAHEINNPLGAILTFAQMLRRDAIDAEEQAEYLREIEESALRCKRIVERLLSFARQAQRDERRSFSLNDVVGETAFLVERSYLPARVRLDRDLDGALAQVQGNPNEISQVLLNLICNARDAMPGGGVVKVRTRNLPDHEVELMVSDTGQGIPQEILGRIFDPFFTTKPEGKGTGLGLSVSYGIIREHHGRINVRSRVGEGTEFQVVLPGA